MGVSNKNTAHLLHFKKRNSFLGRAIARGTYRKNAEQFFPLIEK